jgi:phosphoribosylaminoimidazole carboxylase
MGKLWLYAEKWVAFEKELAVVVVRTEDDEGKLRDVFMRTTFALRCFTLCVRCQQKSPRKRARRLCRCCSNIKGQGVFAIEMFLLQDLAGSIVVNEVAPRPHNSGEFSGFFAHIYRPPPH